MPHVPSFLQLILPQSHSRFGDSSEQLALRVKEKLQDKYSISSYFDVSSKASVVLFQSTVEYLCHLDVCKPGR